MGVNRTADLQTISQSSSASDKPIVEVFLWSKIVVVLDMRLSDIFLLRFSIINSISCGVLIFVIIIS
jgi:hypothetical protein